MIAEASKSVASSTQNLIRIACYFRAWLAVELVWSGAVVKSSWARVDLKARVLCGGESESWGASTLTLLNI